MLKAVLASMALWLLVTAVLLIPAVLTAMIFIPKR